MASSTIMQAMLCIAILQKSANWEEITPAVHQVAVDIDLQHL